MSDMSHLEPNFADGAEAALQLIRAASWALAGQLDMRGSDTAAAREAVMALNPAALRGAVALLGVFAAQGLAAAVRLDPACRYLEGPELAAAVERLTLDTLAAMFTGDDPDNWPRTEEPPGAP